MATDPAPTEAPSRAEDPADAAETAPEEPADQRPVGAASIVTAPPEVFLAAVHGLAAARGVAT